MWPRGVGAGLTLSFLSFIICCASYGIETQVGSFDLRGAPITEATIMAQLGEGRVEIERFGDKVLGMKHMYYVPETESCVELGLSHVLTERKERVLEAILMTKERLCDPLYIPKKPLGHLATGRGIRLGDDLDKVLQAYGQPTVLIEVGKDNAFSALVERLNLKDGRVLRYLPIDSKDNCFAEFYFKREKLHSLVVSASE